MNNATIEFGNFTDQHHITVTGYLKPGVSVKAGDLVTTDQVDFPTNRRQVVYYEIRRLWYRVKSWLTRRRRRYDPPR